MTLRRLPLAYYCDLLAHKSPFTSLLFGDGEFRVMAGEHQGETWTTYKEQITPRLREELLAAVAPLPPGAPVYHGTDPHIVHPETYRGNDAGPAEVGRVLRGLFPDGGPPPPDWVDGTVWDEASRDGTLGPFLREMGRRRVVMVGNAGMRSGLRRGRFPFAAAAWVECPRHSAFDEVDRLQDECVAHWADDTVYGLCCGLGAGPLAVRLRDRLPGAAILDLGSCLDVFVGQGADRGWRYELYRDQHAHRALIQKHAEGT